MEDGWVDRTPFNRALIPGVTLTVLEVPAYMRPRITPIDIWLVRGWGQEEPPPNDSKMQQGSGWIWMTLRIP